VSPDQILDISFTVAERSVNTSFVTQPDIQERIRYVCECGSNRAGVRLLMSCLLAKLDKPKIDVRKPYTEIGTPDCFSGRGYDEQYISPFVIKNRLPVNMTTAFLTPALRNIDHPLSVSRELVGSPKELYIKALQLLDDVAAGKVPANSVLQEAIRILITMRNERESRMRSLLNAVRKTAGVIPLSAEAIIVLTSQHLACPHSSRLPTLVVAAAYKTVEEVLSEYALPLASHTAADSITGALGDVEVCLRSDNRLVTVYEMKMKSVTTVDIDSALKKIASSGQKIDNYIFVTTDRIDPLVLEYGKSFYEATGGIEISILDCIDFLRHFLTFFHRARLRYLENYQEFVMSEPESAVSQALKEVFLSLRVASEAGKS
jgi:hypothetical protein